VWLRVGVSADSDDRADFDDRADSAGPDRPLSRPAARVVCVDPSGRVLLLHWRDPVSGVEFWEPPGGGIEPGESAWEAACRELAEETGLPASVVTDVSTAVGRDFHWCGRHFRGTETFFLGLAEGHEPSHRVALTEEEQAALLGRAWFTVEEIETSEQPVEPPGLAAILAVLERQAADRSGGLSAGAAGHYLPREVPPTRPATRRPDGI